MGTPMVSRRRAYGRGEGKDQAVHGELAPRTRGKLDPTQGREGAWEERKWVRKRVERGKRAVVLHGAGVGLVR